MSVKLSEHLTTKKLLLAVYPPIIMMFFTSIYGVVDGIFISNFIGKSAFAGVNVIMPVNIIIGSIGFMLGSGGSALVSNTLGKNESQKANKIFTMVVAFTIIIGVILSVSVFFLIKPIALLLNSENSTEQMVSSSITYGKIITVFQVMYMLQNVFQSMLVASEKPMLGFIITAISGVTNMVLDLLFVAIFKWGIIGAGVATGISQTIGAVIPLIYFFKNKTSLLRFAKTSLSIPVLIKSSTNGASELLTNIAMSVVGILYNNQLLKLAGENGVSAYGIIMYAGFIFCTVFIGYTIGVAPFVGYNNGSKNYKELKNILKKSVIFTFFVSFIMIAFVEIFALPLSKIFSQNNQELIDLSTKGFRIYGISFGLCGFGIFSSGFFTALNNGLISAIISFSRSLLFQVVCIIIFPLLFGINGVWVSVIIAEICGIILCFICFLLNRKKYNYF